MPTAPADVGRAAFEPRRQVGELGVVRSVTHCTMSPPRRSGTRRSSAARRPASAPMPIGPYILWPEKAMKSQASADRSGTSWLTACAASSTVSAPASAREREQRLVGRALAGRIGAGRDGEDARARRQQPLQVLDMQPALGVGLQDAQRRAAAPRGELPGHEVGVVFEAADDDLVAAPSAAPRRAPRATGPARRGSAPRSCPT